MNPGAVHGGQDALRSEDGAVLAGIQLMERRLDGSLVKLLGSFYTPGGEHLVGMVMMIPFISSNLSFTACAVSL